MFILINWYVWCLSSLSAIVNNRLIKDKGMNNHNNLTCETHGTQGLQETFGKEE